MRNIYTITNESNIIIKAEPEYIESESSEVDYFHLWSYNITIKNEGSEAVQLLNRYWSITDGNGLTKEVRGPGVIGLQPIIEPGKEFEYTSSVNLSTACGIMFGHYEFKDSGGRVFKSDIPAFSLDSAELVRLPN